MSLFSDIISLLENARHYYIICTNMDGKYSYVSNSYAKRFSHVHKHLVGQPFHITMHPEDITPCTAAGMKCLQNPNQLEPVKIRKYDGNGGYIITQWEFKGIFDEMGNPEGVFCLGYDITDFIEQLEKRDTLLSDIAFSQSHVIRRPLANILGITEILKEYQMPKEIREWIDVLIENANQLDDVIRQVTKEINS